MQTGYDNFWIYQNSRHEPVRNLQKNDNYIYPVLPDNYKQMQNGGYPSNTIVTSINNVASSENGQFNTNSHYMWPHSIYSLPFNSSCANNIQSQMYSTQANNFNYSSQHSQPKTGGRNFNVNIPQKNINNNQKHVTARPPQVSSCSDAENSRIRVKDVFSLNNHSMYNPVADNNSVQTQKNKQFEYPLNYTANNCNRTCDFESNILASKILPPSYVQTEQQRLNNQQQIPHYSGGFCQPNAQISSQNQIQSDDNRVRGNNVHSAGHKPKFQLLSQLLRNDRNQEVPMNLCNAQDLNKRVIVKPNGTNHSGSLKTVTSQNSSERTNNINYHDSSRVNENFNYENSYNNSFAFVQNQNQGQGRVNFPNVNQPPSLSQIPSVEDSRKRQINEETAALSSTNFSNNRVHSRESNLVKITIPHTGQSTYINPYEPSGGSRNCNLSLPCLLESSPKVYQENSTQNYVQHNGCNSLPESSLVRRQSRNTSPGKNHSLNMSPKSVSNDCNSTARNSNFAYNNNSSEDAPGNFISDACVGNDNSNEFVENSPETESISNGETSLSDVTVKLENSGLEVNNSGVQIDQEITIDQVFEEIKTEKYSESFELEQTQQISGNLLSVKETISSKSSNKSEFLPKSQATSAPFKHVGHSTPELGISKDAAVKEQKTEKSNGDQERNVKKGKTSIEERKYVCKINRDKLDLLIQFLKKDDEVVKTKTPEKKHHEVSTQKITNDCISKKEVSLSCSRRKLSKTRIVKNKNNSREMVSMVSLKTSRGEGVNSPTHPQILKTDVNPNVEEERKSGCSVPTQKELKSYNSQEIEGKKCDSKFEPEIENMSDGSQSRESSVDEEKNIVNIMQALQNLKSHFCLSCTLVSPIESFWINVVSGELRCLNCFKKMTLRTDENIFKLKKSGSDDCNSTELKAPTNEQSQKAVENNKEHKAETVCNRCNRECTSEKLDVNIKQAVKSSKDTVVHTTYEERSVTHKCKSAETKDVPRKKSTEEEQKRRESEDKSIKSKDDFEENWRTESKNKRKPSLKEDSVSEKISNSEEKPLKLVKRSYSEGSQVPTNVTTVYHPKQLFDFLGKKNTSREEADKVKKEKKQSTHFKSSVLKETVEQDVKSSSEKSVKQNLFKEEEVSEVSRKDKKHSRKRSNSKEEIVSGASALKSPSKESNDSHRPHTEEGVPKKSTNEGWDKSSKPKIKTTSSQEISERKMPNLKVSDGERATPSTDLLRKRKSMEDEIPRKIRAVEDRSKLTNLSHEKSKTTTSKADDASFKNKTSDKHVSIDFATLPRKKNRDEIHSPKEPTKTEMKNFTESSDKTRRNSTSKENFSSPEHPKKEMKYQNLTSGNSVKEKKYFLGKIPKISHKSSEKVNFEFNKSSPNAEKHQKLTMTSKPLKESQRTGSEVKPTSPSHILKKKEGHDHKHKHRDRDQFDEKNSEKKRKAIEGEDKFEKKRILEQEFLKGNKHDKNQIIRSNKDRALECIFGRKKEDLIINEYKKIHKDNPPSPKLLEKLLEKTKKLSWTLLTKS